MAFARMRGGGFLGRVNVGVVIVVAVLYTSFFLLVLAPAPRVDRRNGGRHFDTAAVRQALVTPEGVPPVVKVDLSAAPSNANEAAAVNAGRREAVRKMALGAWKSYMTHARGSDELRPVSKKRRENWGRTRPTPYDAIGTLIVMGLHEEADEAIDLALAVDFRPASQGKDQNWKTPYSGPAHIPEKPNSEAVVTGYAVSVFETTIRHVGSMLSVFGLTNDEKFLTKASEIVEFMLPAFDTALGIALHQVAYEGSSVGTLNQPWAANRSLLAEAGSLQLEMRYLSAASGEPKYGVLTEMFTRHLVSTLRNDWPTNRDNYDGTVPRMPHKGLWPTFVDPETGRWSGTASLGSMSDSFYEYQLKQWILFGKDPADPQLELYENTVEAILLHLLHYTRVTNIAFVGVVGVGLDPTMDHLTCFVPGMLTLGLLHGAHAERPGRSRSWGESDVATAAVDLAATCRRLYVESPSGVGPEVVEFEEDGSYRVTDPTYILRPETIESFFYLYRYTHDERYRAWGWDIVATIEKHCRAEGGDGGYSALESVLKAHPKQTDSMESFFFAETLKYAFLLFSDDGVLPLDEYVFNTEGHPLRILTGGKSP